MGCSSGFAFVLAAFFAGVAGGLAALGQHGGVVVKAEDQHLLGVLTGELAQLVQVGKGGQEGAPVLGGDEPELHGVFALQVHRPHGVLAVGACHDDRGQKAGLLHGVGQDHALVLGGVLLVQLGQSLDQLRIGNGFGIDGSGHTNAS